MASEPTKQGGNSCSSVLCTLKNFTLNSYRRLLILGHYTTACFHQQRLRRTWSDLGKNVHQAVETGENNPLLNESVQEKLNRAEAVKGSKERHYEAIATLKDKIRGSKAGAEAPPETEPEEMQK